MKFRDLRLHRVKMSNNPEHENVTYNCDMCKFKPKFRKELMQHKQLKHGQTYLLSLTEKTLLKFVLNIAINTSFRAWHRDVFLIVAQILVFIHLSPFTCNKKEKLMLSFL